MRDPGESNWTEREKLAILFTDRFCLDLEACDESLLSRMKAHFTVPEIIELAHILAWVSGMHRVNALFDLDPAELQTPAGKLYRTIGSK